MEKKTKLIANYSQTGHPQYQEDTWSDECEISNKKDLFNAMKHWYKQSAYNFNDFPFNGLFHTHFISFTKQDYVIIDGVEYYADEIETEKPSYWDDVVKQFEQYEQNLKDRLPRLRKAKTEKLKRDRDLAKLEYLKSKYE